MRWGCGAKMNKIDEFLENFSEKTKPTYLAHINNFFKAIEVKNPDKYFDVKRDYDKDVTTYQNSMKDRPPKSSNSAISCVKTFLLANNIELQPVTKFNLRKRKKGARAWTQDETCTPEQLKKILQHGNAKSRALFLLASSTGARIGELLQLVPEDIDMDNIPMKIKIRGEYTKTGDPRVVFASDESKATLQAWLKERDKYLHSATEKYNKAHPGFYKNPKDIRIFPFSYATTKMIWNTLAEKSGFNQRDPKTDRRLYHIHGLRKYFRSRLGIDVDITEALMGHEQGIRTVYRKYTEEQLAEMYLQGMMNLQVFERQSKDVTDIRKELAKRNGEIQEMKQEMDRIRMELLEVKMKQVQELQRKNGLK